VLFRSPLVFYTLHNVSRHVSFRSSRASAASHMRKKHYVGDTQMRLVPARPLRVSEDVIKRNIVELRQKAAQHILEVRTLDGRLVDLETMEAAPAAPMPLLPHPKLDSVADDKQVGQYIPPYVGDDMAMPLVLPPGEKPALLKDSEMNFPPPAATPEAPPADITTDADLEAAIEAAQQEAAEEPPAPTTQEAVSSEAEQARKGRRNRR